MSPELTTLFGQALALHQAGQIVEAEPLYRRVLQAEPRHFDSLHLLGVIHYQRAEYQEAARQIEAALRINRNVAAAHNNLGNALKDLGRPKEALASYGRAVALKADYAEAFYNRGNVLRTLGRPDEAVASYDRALALRPDYGDALTNRGSALKDLGRCEEALASHDQAIALNPGHVEAWHNRANALDALDRYEEALASCERAIALRPSLIEAHNNRANALKRLRRLEEAVEGYDRALALQPNYADAINNRANVLKALKRFDEALADYDRTIALVPDHVEAFFNRGLVLVELKRYERALADFDRVKALDPQLDHLKGIYLHTRMHMCDWTDFDALCAELNADAANGLATAHPFEILACRSTPAAQLACARTYVAEKRPAYSKPLWRGERYAHERIRVAYLSADLREHPVAYLMAGMFARHDRSRFETIAISLGEPKPSALRERLKGSFERFVEAHAMNDRAVAELLRSLEVDIAVDLNGYTEGSRPDIFGHKPTPVQVNYLGYAATLGRDYCDYIVADRFVIPEHARTHYAEQVVYLPECFMVQDSDRKIADHKPSRAEAGLPEAGFVFCGFNNTIKVTPDLFDVWMRLLRQVEGSVLWLSNLNGYAPNNLRREAEARGVGAERLVFAPLVARNEDHLARIGLADLFLDTLYYNAHTATADALWAGLPVLTCPGATFASRVAGSLLGAVGLPELITGSLAEYETLAVQLARDPQRLAALRQKLARNRTAGPLFDTARFTRHMERAYVTMWERAERGERPQGFAVSPIDRSVS